MPRALGFTCAVLLCSVILNFDSDRCLAQRTNCETSFDFEGSRELRLSSLFQIFSEKQQTSVLAEIPYESTSIEVPSGTYSLDGLAKMFDPALHCKAVEGVLHVFDDNVISLKGNALNYRFAFFKLPPNVDRFQNLLRERLVDEAFAPPKNGKSVIQELGSGISANADSFPLQEQTYRDVQTRNLVFAVASKYILSSVICFPNPKIGSTDLDVWKFAASHWYWGVIDGLGTAQ
jgi:hypothetical protein